MATDARKHNTRGPRNNESSKQVTLKPRIKLSKFLQSWDDRQIELLLLRNKSPSWFVGDVEGLKANWGEILAFDAVYFGLNPSNVNPADRNCIVKKAIGRGAKNITSISYIFVDVDPVRPPDVCATDGEKREARSIAVKIRKYLAKQGFSDPWVFDSGNGYHLLYPCRLETRDVELHKRLLASLASRFDTNDVKVDQVVSDLPRVCRLPFTWNRKGPDTRERPHRKTTILQVPTASGSNHFVTRDILMEVLGEPEDRPDEHAENCPSTEPMRRNVVDRVSNYVVQMSPSVSRHGGHDKLFSAACKTVELGCSRAEARLVIETAFNPRCLPPWSQRDIEHKLDDAFEECGADAASSETRSIAIEGGEDSGTDFFGFVPDFADFPMDILRCFPLLKGQLSCTFFVEQFALMQFKNRKPIVPTEFVRQFFFQQPMQQNWRSRLTKHLNGNWRRLDSFRKKESFPDCVFCQTGYPPHTHFQISPQLDSRMNELLAIRKPNGDVVYADQRKAEYGSVQVAGKKFAERSDSFFCFDGKNYKRYRDLQRKNIIRKAYWPILLFGWKAGFLSHEIRALLGITNEYTRLKEDKGKPMVISNARVPLVKNTSGICPVLDKNEDFVVFGGNRKNGVGQGYQLFGRTEQGWIHRIGFWDAYRREKGRETQKAFRQLVAKFFFGSLEKLPAELGLIVAAYHPGRNEWKGLDELQIACRSEPGFNWINNATIRIFAPVDWCNSWRSYFSKQLGYRWIPATSAECRPTSTQLECPAELLAYCKVTGCSRQELSRRLSQISGKDISPKKIQRHLSGVSKTQGFWRVVAELIGLKN